MSQHYFETVYENKSATILMGWDRPLQGFFMVIQNPSDPDSPFWSNLDHTPSHPKTLEVFLKVIRNFNIQIPEEMIHEILDDGRQNMGNKCVYHTFNNSMYERVEG